MDLTVMPEAGLMAKRRSQFRLLLRVLGGRLAAVCAVVVWNTYRHHFVFVDQPPPRVIELGGPALESWPPSQGKVFMRQLGGRRAWFFVSESSAVYNDLMVRLNPLELAYDSSPQLSPDEWLRIRQRGFSIRSDAAWSWHPVNGQPAIVNVYLSDDRKTSVVKVVPGR